MINLFALHGFLGLPADWDFIRLQNLRLHSVNIYDPAIPKDGFWKWAQNFNRYAAQFEGPKVLMGYSLGGRLALHALTHNSEQWLAAVVISAYPGGMTGREEELRRNSDEKWSERFLSEPWDELMVNWNSQETLRSSESRVRDEKNYDRVLLSETCRFWTSGLQDNLLSSVKKMPLPILWMVGERDKKYVGMTDKLTFAHSRSKIWIAPEAGHRLPWDIPEKFQIQLDEFLNQVLHEGSREDINKALGRDKTISRH